jgi:hypothetical protein
MDCYMIAFNFFIPVATDNAVERATYGTLERRWSLRLFSDILASLVAWAVLQCGTKRWLAARMPYTRSSTKTLAIYVERSTPVRLYGSREHVSE